VVGGIRKLVASRYRAHRTQIRSAAGGGSDTGRRS
jgi:hypothetical protein